LRFEPFAASGTSSATGSPVDAPGGCPQVRARRHTTRVRTYAREGKDRAELPGPRAWRRELEDEREQRELEEWFAAELQKLEREIDAMLIDW